MSKPVVAIVGRPNVGKSSLFNRMVGRRLAVVDSMSGVTRDRNYADTCWEGIEFTVVDTGGLIPYLADGMVDRVRAQVDRAIAEADLVVFLVDGSTGPTDLDLGIAKRLRKGASDRMVLAANKVESESRELELGGFMSLGCGEPIALSALHGMGTRTLLEHIVAKLQARALESKPHNLEESVKVAVVGRPNAGKSSLVNKLLNQERMIVDPIPGTTRDSIDSHVKFHGSAITIVDTAGLRRKSQVKNDVEYYGNLRALESIERADVCALLVDAAQEIGEQDLRIVRRIDEMRKGLVVCFNKWDIMEKDEKTFDRLVAELRHRYMQLRHVPILAVSALTGKRLPAVLENVLRIRQRLTSRVPPGRFRESVRRWTRTRPHPNVRNKQVRVMGGKQVSASYPMFHFFAANHTLVQPSYRRYLANKIYEEFDFEGCPVVLAFRPLARKKRGSRIEETPMEYT
jgi:GTP-binding protein